MILNDCVYIHIYTYMMGGQLKVKQPPCQLSSIFRGFSVNPPWVVPLGFPSWNSIGRGQATNQVSTSHGTQNWGLEMGSSVHQISWFFLGGECFFRGELWLRLGFFRTFRLPLIHLQKWKVGKYEDDTSEAKTCLLSRVEHSKCKLLSP